jgi:cytochrome c-type biogenesis protein
MTRTRCVKIGLITVVAALALCRMLPTGVTARGDTEPSATAVSDAAVEDDAIARLEAVSSEPMDPELPTLIEAGATDCVPCRQMAPIIDALREDTAGRLNVRFVNVRTDDEARARYGVMVMPTQLFLDADGIEIHRHIGFLGRDAIIEAWAALGYDFGLDWQPIDEGSLMSRIGRAIEAAWWVALPAAMLWGILSVVLSPCHLASIPLVIAVVSGQGGGVSARRAWGLSCLFALGILATIAVIGVITAAAGRLLGDSGPMLTNVVAILLVAVGLHLCGGFALPWFGVNRVHSKHRGALAAVGTGLAFGVAVGPCTFAFMAPMIGLALHQGTTHFAHGALLLLAFGVGHASVIALAGGLVGLVQRYVSSDAQKRHVGILRTACGVLVVASGLYLLGPVA